jgi:hypothetical protein
MGTCTWCQLSSSGVQLLTLQESRLQGQMACADGCMRALDVSLSSVCCSVVDFAGIRV